MRVLFSVTLFLSAALLFLIQPMFARMVLPKLGGTPAVWNTCMLFFQAALLLGYGYAHVLTNHVPARLQAFVHFLLLFVPAVALPISVPESWIPTTDANPVLSLLVLLAVRVGPPFFVLSTSAPLVQRWFARTGEKDPYFLYAASNLGSMIGLLGYPLLLEPRLRIVEQSRVFTGGYIALAALIAVCAFAVRTRPDIPAVESEPTPFRRVLRWIALAAVPSSFMLGVTTYVTTDIAAVPMLWVIPLGLYLLSFVLVFGKQTIPHAFWVRALPVTVLIVVALRVSETGVPAYMAVPAHVLAFFVSTMVCHGELAKDRPPAKQLTAYYLAMSVGGVVGGLFNALLAPVVFSSIAEYPVTIAVACLLAPAVAARTDRRWLDVVVPLAAGAATIVTRKVSLGSSLEAAALVGAAPVLVLLVVLRRPLGLGLSVGAVFLALGLAERGDLVREARSFFAVHEVDRVAFIKADAATVDSKALPRHTFHSLRHGTTIHGLQRLDAENRPTAPDEALSYFFRTGPMGQVISHVSATGSRSVAVIGMGTASLAAYAKAGQSFTYFEIDPVVLEIAEDTRCFTYIDAARKRGATVETVLGDARLTLARAKDGSFDLIALDAFSSDSVPVHLLTREAIEKVYLPKLKPGAFLIFNITNRFLELRPVIAAAAAELGLVARCRDDNKLEPEDVAAGKTRSRFAVMARREEDLAFLRDDPRWEKLVPQPGFRVWTDDFSNLLSAIDWKKP